MTMSKHPTYQGKILYEKKNGKYVPSNDPHAYDGLANGAWLVVVKPGSASMRQAINPSFMELEAALRYLEDGLCEAMMKQGAIRSRTVKMSEKERRAWKVFDSIMGKDKPTMFEYPSNCEIATAGCEYIRKIMTENKCNIEAIKEKYQKKTVNKNNILGLDIKGA